MLAAVQYFAHLLQIYDNRAIPSPLDRLYSSYEESYNSLKAYGNIECIQGVLFFAVCRRRKW